MLWPVGLFIYSSIIKQYKRNCVVRILINFFRQIPLEYLIKEIGMGGVRTMRVEVEKCVQTVCWKASRKRTCRRYRRTRRCKRGHRNETTDVEMWVKVILKWMLRNIEDDCALDSSDSVYGLVADFCECDFELSGSIKMENFLTSIIRFSRRSLLYR
jgi:hypothetical protein